MQITTIGLDIAKNVFQVHGIDAAEKVVVRKQLRRGQILGFFEALPRCLVGMEACATSHYWARELTKLGHQVRLMPAKDVKAYVKRNKNDAAANPFHHAAQSPPYQLQLATLCGLGARIGKDLNRSHQAARHRPPAPDRYRWVRRRCRWCCFLLFCKRCAAAT